MNVGTQILEEIIDAHLVRAECEGLCVWEANSPEVLEAIVLKYAPILTREIKESIDAHR